MPAPKFARLMSSASLQQQEGDKRRGSTVDLTADDVRRELVGAFKVGLRFITCINLFQLISVVWANQQTDTDDSGFLDRNELEVLMKSLKISFKDVDQDIDWIFGTNCGHSEFRLTTILKACF